MVAAMTRPCGALTMEGRKHIKLVAGSVGAVVIVGAGVATAVIQNTGSTNGNGGGRDHHSGDRFPGPEH
jgi:hypothetical protein